MRVERTVESFIHDGTLTDLLVANYLRPFAQLRDVEEVIKLEMTPPDKDGVRTIKFMFIEEREATIIRHT